MSDLSFYGNSALVQTCPPAGYNLAMRALRIAACVALLTTLVFSEKHFNPPPAAHARNYALHESHDDEKVTIAIEPCDTPQTAGVFKVNYKGYGLYPVRLIISNDSDGTLMLDDMKIE